MTTAGYLIEGMTCGNCVAKVLEKIGSLSGVTHVATDLVAGGRSPLVVTSGTKLGADQVRAAVESAGFGLLPPGRREATQQGNASSTADCGTHSGRQRVSTSIGGVSS